MFAYYSFEGDINSCVTRVRFSPQINDYIAVGVDSSGYIRLMDLNIQKSTNYKYFENMFMENDMNLPHLCDFSFNNTGKCVYVSSSDGFVSISSLNMIGNHLNKDNHLLTIHDTHIGGTFCVYPSPNYDFMIYTGGGDGFLRLWDLRLLSNKNIYNINENIINNKSNKPLLSLWAHLTPLSSMSLKVNNRIITCGFNENVRIWDSQSLSPIQTIDGGCGEMGVWDLIVDENRSKVITVGELGTVNTFDYINEENNFICKNLKIIKQEDGENENEIDYVNEEQILFRNWRRICQYGENIIIPSHDNEDNIKAFIIDIYTGKIIDKLKYQKDSELNYHNISSVDVHPDPNVGLIITGGSVLNGRCTVWVDKNKF